MSRCAGQVAHTDRHFHLLARHHELVAAHRVLQQKPFDQREHTSHKQSLRQHLAMLLAHRLDAKPVEQPAETTRGVHPGDRT